VVASNRCWATYTNYARDVYENVIDVVLENNDINNHDISLVNGKYADTY